MEADLARYYSRDADQLPAFYRGQLTLRRLQVLVKGLPQESQAAKAIGGHGWPVRDYLLADLFAIWAEQPHPFDPRVAGKPKVPNEQLVAGYARSNERRERLGIRGSVLRQ